MTSGPYSDRVLDEADELEEPEEPEDEDTEEESSQGRDGWLERLPKMCDEFNREYRPT